jgi:hypothetical protein
MTGRESVLALRAHRLAATAVVPPYVLTQDSTSFDSRGP